MKKSLLVLFSIIIGVNINSHAYDFYALSNGDTIYYKITSSTSPRTVAVTYGGTDYYPLFNSYTGDISIPLAVSYGGNNYSVTSIYHSAFAACSGLTTVTIPTSVTNIGYYAFQDCTALTSITIPNSVDSIGSYAFFGCSGLVSVDLPNNLEVIGKSTFRNCTSLPLISLPNSLVSIQNYAFYNCSNIEKVVIPYNINHIGEGAFKNCSNLDSVFFNASNIHIDSVFSYLTPPFEGCVNLNTVIIGDSVKRIPHYTFMNCSSLTSITLPQNLTIIGYSAFENCTSLSKITLGDSLSYINPRAFFNCDSIDTIYYNAINCINLESNFKNKTNLKSLNIGNQVIKIPQYAFEGCSGLSSLVIPNSVRIIDGAAFRNCIGLTSVIIPNSVTIIGSSAFANCSGLTSIIIGESVETISGNAFSECINVSNIDVKAYTPPDILSTTFNNIDIHIPIIVPCVSLSLYQSEDYWELFTNYVVPTQTPTDLSLVDGENFVEIRWQSGETAFEVYRNDSLIANVNQTNYLDYDIQNGHTYCYKVRAKDGDCISEFSDTICISVIELDNISSLSLQVKLYPNPTEGKAILEVEGLESEAEVLLFDMYGRHITKYIISPSSNELEIDVTRFTKGVYNILILNDNVSISKKLIVN